MPPDTSSNVACKTRYDLLCVGRSSIDLYAANVGVPFHEISSFNAYVGGCPTNIAVGAARLGLKTALLTAVGDDPVGDFILHFLKREGVETRYIPRKPGYRSSAVLLGIEPPGRFPLVFYREGCADRRLDEEDAARAPVGQSRFLLVAGTNLSHSPAREATQAAARAARRHGRTVVLDLDFRLDQWESALAYGEQVRRLLPLVNVAVGTEEEFRAVFLEKSEEAVVAQSQVSSPTVLGQTERAIEQTLAAGVETAVVKKGAQGAEAVLRGGERFSAGGFQVKVLNVLGAGDAFAAGLIYGLIRTGDWRSALRIGNACGAYLVTQPGCSNFMPTRAQVAAVMGEAIP